MNAMQLTNVLKIILFVAFNIQSHFRVIILQEIDAKDETQMRTSQVLFNTAEDAGCR